MFDQKGKRESEATELSVEESGFELTPTHVEIGSGYTLQVSHDQSEHPVVNVKTYGKVDIQKLRREIERTFPNAHIRQLNQTPIVTVARKSKKIPKPRKK